MPKERLEGAKMLDAKLAYISLATNLAFTTDGKPYFYANHYCSIAEALQYLIITQTDISYAVNNFSKL